MVVNAKVTQSNEDYRKQLPALPRVVNRAEQQIKDFEMPLQKLTNNKDY